MGTEAKWIECAGEYRGKQETIVLQILEFIGEGSNCYTYQGKIKDDGGKYIIKVPKNSFRPVSTQLQFESIKLLFHHGNINVPEPVFFGLNDEFGEISIYEYKTYESIEDAIQENEINQLQVIEKYIKLISMLHDMKIAGFGLKLYWDCEKKEVLILSAGIPYTFDFNMNSVLKKHMDLLANNKIGKWWIVSQLVNKKDAIYLHDSEKYLELEFPDLITHISEDSSQIHLKKLAYSQMIRLLTMIGMRTACYEIKEIFNMYYVKSNSKLMSFEKMAYAKQFLNALDDDTISECINYLYYTIEEPIARTSTKEAIILNMGVE